jgi:hypothetical protein
MITLEQQQETWDRVMWVRSGLWLFALVTAAAAALNVFSGRPWLAVVCIALAASEAEIARLMTKRDDRGWWLAIGLLGGSVVFAAASAVFRWALADLLGAWIPLCMLRELRRPPAFPWRRQEPATSA